ncbi:MAG: PAS domain S-box protein [Thermodesulfobacteriota bacterium]
MAPHLSVVAPLYSDVGSPRPLGTLLLVSDANEFLFPLIQSWPLPSRTAETLLVRRDGDEALFLNSLRHQPGAALNLRIPLNRTDVPAVMAIMGKVGVVRGKDYRGVDVLSAVLPVPDSPWFIVSKMDTEEAFAGWRNRSLLILSLIVILTGMTVVAGFAFWQREKKYHFQTILMSEAARKVDEERYRITLHSIGDAVIATDAGGRVTIMNAVAEKLTGWNENEARQRHLDGVFRIVNEETGSTVESPVTKVLNEGVVVGLANHTMLIAKDGARRPIADSGAPIRDENGNITGVVLVFRDQTEEREAREALFESEQKHRRLFESMTDAFVSTDMAGVLQEFNPAYQAMLGYDDGELRRLTYQDLTPEKWHAMESEIVEKQILKTGFSDVYEKEYRRRDGSIFPVELRTFLIRDDANQPIGMWTIVRDITIRKRMERELSLRNRIAEIFLTSSSEEMYLKVLTDILEELASPFGVFGYLDEKGALVVPTMTRTVWDRCRIPDKQFVFPRETWGDSSWPRCLRIKQATFTNKPSDRTPAGHIRITRHISIPLLHMGEAIGLIQVANKDTDYTVEDVSLLETIGKSIAPVLQARLVAERQSIEKEKLHEQLLQSQKMESVGRLAGGVAHDFNNMLNVILGYAELALEKVALGDPLRDDLTEIFDAGRRSAEITHQLLAFARKQIIIPRALSLNDNVEKLLKMLRRLIGEDIDLVWKPGPGLWPVYTDSSQIDQILANLCVNARDAIEGVGRITIETGNVILDDAYCTNHAEFIPGEFVVLTVSDNGRGMNNEIRQHIFEPFFTTKDVGEGTGLGLAMVYGIARQNNGFINVYSEVGQGTTFKIYLPRYMGAVEITEVRDSMDIQPGRGETVLVVEDEAPVLRLSRKVLTELGYVALAAHNPREALKLAGEHPGAIDLLITDLVMPEMNGRDLAERMLTLYPALKVLFMSGYTSETISRHGVLEKGVHFIQKPFNKKDLAGKVREALDE